MIFYDYFRTENCYKSIRKDRSGNKKLLVAYVGWINKFPDLKFVSSNPLVTCKWVKTCYKTKWGGDYIKENL
jgi:hypothetical protein